MDGKMIYTPDHHIPVLLVYRDNFGIIHFVIKRSGKERTEDFTMDKFLEMVYQAVA